jgi:hypothetical protein
LYPAPLSSVQLWSNTPFIYTFVGSLSPPKHHSFLCFVGSLSRPPHQRVSPSGEEGGASEAGAPTISLDDAWKSPAPTQGTVGNQTRHQKLRGLIPGSGHP